MIHFNHPLGIAAGLGGSVVLIADSLHHRVVVLASVAVDSSDGAMNPRFVFVSDFGADGSDETAFEDVRDVASDLFGSYIPLCYPDMVYIAGFIQIKWG